ncbi:MAG: hypothetical protein V3U54_04840 [Thermodesulfobacteriota bacterium]
MSAQKCQKCGVVVFFYRDKSTGAEKCPSCGTTNPHTPNPHTPPKEEDPIKCPKCGSAQLTANKQGFGPGKAAIGGVLTGGIGLLAGFIGSGKLKITCLKCGHVWKAGKA